MDFDFVVLQMLEGSGLLRCLRTHLNGELVSRLTFHREPSWPRTQVELLYRPQVGCPVSCGGFILKEPNGLLSFLAAGSVTWREYDLWEQGDWTALSALITERIQEVASPDLAAG